MRTLKNYIFWSYERGSFHYDVMVTLILAFLFISPHYIDFKDKPQDGALAPRQALVQEDGRGGYVYILRSEDVPRETGDLNSDLLYAVVQMAGPVSLDKSEEITEHGKVTGYKVWIHRP